MWWIKYEPIFNGPKITVLAQGQSVPPQTGRKKIPGRGGPPLAMKECMERSGEWSTSRSGRFIPGTHWIGGRVGPRVGWTLWRKYVLLIPRVEPRTIQQLAWSSIQITQHGASPHVHTPRVKCDVNAGCLREGSNVEWSTPFGIKTTVLWEVTPYKSADAYFAMGYSVAQLVDEQHYKPEGRGFGSRRCHGNFSLT
jgi:hypothetical protein